MAKRRRRKVDERGKKSRAGRDGIGSPARLSTITVVMQVVALARVLIDVLRH